MSLWKDTRDNDPKHCLKHEQRVDLFVQKHDISGPSSYRIPNCYFDAELGLFITDDHRIVKRILHGHRITHFVPVELPK